MIYDKGQWELCSLLLQGRLEGDKGVCFSLIYKSRKINKYCCAVFFMKNWKKEAARDVLALGSWIFYLLVVGRALIKPYRPFVDQIVIAAVVLILAGLIFVKWEKYVARGLVLAFFTSLFYEDALFTGFSILVFGLMIVSSKMVGNSWKEIVFGILIGGVGILAGWFGGGISLGVF